MPHPDPSDRPNVFGPALGPAGDLRKFVRAELFDFLFDLFNTAHDILP